VNLISSQPVSRPVNSKIYILCIVFFFSACATPNQTEKKKQPEVDPFVQNELLSKTINFGNALEAPDEGEWGVVLQAKYFSLVKAAGFTAVRLPIRWSAHCQIDSPFTIHSVFMQRIDWAVNQAEENHLALIIDLHHFNEIFSNPEREHGKFLSLWQQIAEHYKDRDSSLFFEILNEPHDRLTEDLWNTYLSDALEVIRHSNPVRTVIIGTAQWGGIGSLQKLIVPETDQNLIVTIHYYNPFHFTHQGASWVQGSEQWLGTEWTASPQEKQSVVDDFRNIANWADSHKRPIFVGEFGSYSRADMDSRIRWTTFVREVAEKNHFSWAYWEFCSGFGVYDPRSDTWKDALLQALIP